MNETLKRESAIKFTDEVKTKLQAYFESDEFRSFAAKTKAATDAGSFEVVISTADIDRQGETIDQNGWDTDQYAKNPVVLWAHDYFSLPIGIAEEIRHDGDKLIAKGRFAPAEANPFAQQVRQLYDLKIVRATSVGFIVREMDGKKITKAELLEFSFVPVPANPFALSLSQARHLDLAMIAAKGLAIETKAEGDPCTMEDGAEGEYHPNPEGVMVCMPKPEEKAEGDTCALEDGSEGVIDAEGNCVAKPQETKGEIAEQVTAEGQRKQKWARLNRVWDIFDAFIGVYLDEKTPVEDFDKLLDEAISLMRQPSPETKGVIADALKDEKRAKFILRAKDAEKIGAELAAMQNEIDDSIVRHSKTVIEIVQSEYPQSTPPQETAASGLEAKGGEGEESRASGDPKQRSRDARSLLETELDSFLIGRQVLRAIANTASSGLERMNKKAREHAAKAAK